MQPFLIAFTLTLLAGLSTGLGAAIAFFAPRANTRFLSVCTGLSAGVMLYVSFMEMLPEAFRQIAEAGFAEKPATALGTLGFFAGIALILVSALIILYPLTTKYIFGPEAIEIRDLSFREVPARYDSVYRVEESEGIVAGSHCTASGCIVIRYDRESNRMIAITPSDRDAAMALLRTRCPSAEFTMDYRS